MGSLSKFRKAPHNRCYGMEVECYPTLRPALDYVGFWYVTTDMSLNAGGREFVSQPMPYDMLVRQVRQLEKRVAGWNTDSRCGLHIHVSRSAWTREVEFSKMLRTFWASDMEQCFGRYSHFADPWGAVGDKCRAVNVLHRNSYEFRMWKAGDLYWTLEALRRTRAIVEHRGKWTKEALFKICNAHLPAEREVVHQSRAGANAAPARRDVRQLRDSLGCNLATERVLQASPPRFVGRYQELT